MVGRIALVLLAALICFIAANLVVGSKAAMAAAASLALVLWVGTGSRNRLVRGALLGAGWCGVIGFVGGFLGPMLLAPEANQGPMLGLFITGPGGVLIGGICGAVIAAGKPG